MVARLLIQPKESRPPTLEPVKLYKGTRLTRLEPVLLTALISPISQSNEQEHTLSDEHVKKLYIHLQIY